jgi:2-polyprenyl-3-methyl-5-hydroxy-6-metoxy-1,4-benzoquinol methylase
MPDQVDYSIYYLRWHDETDKHYSDSQRFYARVLAPALAQVPRGESVLDVGCGTGVLVHSLLQMGYERSEGIDTSIEQISVAVRRGLPCRQVDRDHIHELARLRPGAYGAIFLLDVLEHVPKRDQIALLRSLARLTRPGGKLIVSVPNANSALGLRWLYQDWTHESAFTQESLEFVLLNAGFQGISYFPFEFVGRPRFVWVPRKAVLYWALNRVVRLVRRVEVVAELGRQGWSVPLSLNLLAICSVPAR